MTASPAADAPFQPSLVLDFWFDAANQPFWFEKNADFDAAFTGRLLPAHEAAVAGRLRAWEDSAEGVLALCILLDQLPRNAFRGQARAFASDAEARRVARIALERGDDLKATPEQRLFLYLPFEHSEELADQYLSEALFTALGNAYLLDYARRHREVVERFGRFPHRNQAVGRASTPEEAAFLQQPGSSF